MSYVTGQCKACLGLAYICNSAGNKTSNSGGGTLACLAAKVADHLQRQQQPQQQSIMMLDLTHEAIKSFSPCKDCAKCTSCIDGKVVNMGNLKAGKASATTSTAASGSGSSASLASAKPRPLQLHALPEDEEAKASPIETSIISLANTIDSSDPARRTAGKAARKKRPESHAAYNNGSISLSPTSPTAAGASNGSLSQPSSPIKTHMQDTSPAAFISPAMVAAVSMSRIRSASADPAIAVALSPTTKLVKHQPSQHMGNVLADDQDDLMSPTTIDHGDGTVSTTSIASRRVAAVKKRISMMTADEEVGGVVLKGPPPPTTQPNHGGNGHGHYNGSNHNLTSSLHHSAALAENGTGASGIHASSGNLNNTHRRAQSNEIPDNPLNSSASLVASTNAAAAAASQDSFTSAASSAIRSPNAQSTHDLTTARSHQQDLFGFGASRRKGSSGNILLSGGQMDAGHSPADGVDNSDKASIHSGDGPVPTSPSALHGSLSKDAAGIIGARKGKKPSIISLSSPTSGDAPTNPSDISRKNSKGAWTASDSSKFTSLGDLTESDEFPDVVHLHAIFSTKGNAQGTLDRMIWSARCYDIAKQRWNLEPPVEKPKPAPVPNDEIKYRILENFSDGPIPTVTYSTREDGLPAVIAGNIDSLLDALIFPLTQDDTYASVFLATYRFFVPPSEILTSLIEWYNVEADENATPQQEQYLKKNRRFFRARAIRVLLRWMKNHWLDFHTDPELLEELMNFVADVSEISFGDSQRMTQAIREQRLSWYMTQYIPPFSNKRAILSEAIKPWALLWEAEAFAEQITLIDSQLFRQIRPDCYLHVLRSPLLRQNLSDSVAFRVIMEYVSWFRLGSSYAATLILKEDGTKKRTKAIRRFIKIAKICRELNNFNSAFAIMHGLKRPAITRLTAAWDGVPAKYMESFKELDALIDPTDGFANFWAQMKDAQTPLIPFFGAYIHDLLEVHEDEPMFVSELPPESLAALQNITGKSATTTGEEYEEDEENKERINFIKYQELYAIISEIEVWRASSYRELLPEASAAASDAKIDTSAVVLNHMRAYPLVDDRLLDLDPSGDGVPHQSRTPSHIRDAAFGALGFAKKRISTVK